MSSVAVKYIPKDVQSHALQRSKAISVELRRVARRARSPRPTISGGGGFRARRSDKIFRWVLIGIFGVCFMLPVMLSALYLSIFASDQYVTEARFSVKAGENNGLEALASISTFLNVAQSPDAMMIAEYIKSQGIVDEIGKAYDVRKMFYDEQGDFWARAREDYSTEEFLKYWKNQVDVNVDRVSGLVTLKVRAFRPNDSYEITKSIIAISERMVNTLTRRNEEQQLAEAGRELELARKRLENAVTAMREARQSIGVLDVELSAKAYSEILTGVQLELSKVDLQIGALTINNATQSPQVAALTARRQSLRDQVAVFEGKLAGGMGANPTEDVDLASRAAVLAQRDTELKVAQSEYKNAVADYESARLTKERQRAYLLEYISPRVADSSLYPRRWLAFIGVAVVSFVFAAIAGGLALLVRDHTA